MTRLDFSTFHLANGLVAGTGLWYGWMQYLCQPETEFAVMNHPWQPHLQHAHILVAPFLVAVAGHFWVRHAWLSWKFKVQEGRKTGASMMWMLIPMILSGYCIQVSVEPATRLVWVWVHGISSIVWLVAYFGHTVIHLYARRKSSA